MNAQMLFANMTASNSMLTQTVASAMTGKHSHAAVASEEGGFAHLLHMFVQGNDDSNLVSEMEAWSTQWQTLLDQLTAGDEWTDADWGALMTLLAGLSQTLPMLQTDQGSQMQMQLANWLEHNAASLGKLADLLQEPSARNADQTTLARPNMASVPVDLEQITSLLERLSMRKETPLLMTEATRPNVNDGLQALQRLAQEAKAVLQKLAVESSADSARGNEQLRTAPGKDPSLVSTQRVGMFSSENAGSDDLMQPARNTHWSGQRIAFVQPFAMHTMALNGEGESIRTDAQRAEARLPLGLESMSMNGENGNRAVRAYTGIESTFSTVLHTEQVRAAVLAEPPARPAPTTVHAQDFMQELNRLFSKMQTFRGDGLSEVKFKLVPEHLGHVDVHIKMQNGQLTALMMADRLAGKEMLESQLALLRASIQNQGIQVDKIEVTHQPANQQGLLHDQRNQQSFHAYSNERTSEDETGWIDEEWVAELEEQTGSARLAHGGVFDVTA